MKTTKLRLFATMISLAAVITATTIPAHAQRRSTQKNTESRQRAGNRNENHKRQERSTFKGNDKISRSRINPKLKSTSNYQQKERTAISRNSSRSRQTAPKHVQRGNYANSSSRIINGRQDENRRISRSPGNVRTTTRVESGQRDMTNRRTINSSSRNKSSHISSSERYSSKEHDNRQGRSNIHRTTGRNVTNTRNFYGVTRSDKRYTPNNNYRGSKHYWSDSHRTKHRDYRTHNREYYRHYNYKNYRHWDRSWERFRWNHNSWREYYHGYHSHSYVYHSHYYYHNHFGHVIRRFNSRPYVFIHNHRNYYCYNGHFFRYRRGVGYILVDMPYGFGFEVLPHNYDRVYINGYLYFRIGNLFFEWSGGRFVLVHYPERYYAYDDGYCNNGYHFYDDY